MNMDNMLLRPRDGRPTKCLECGRDPLPQGSIHSHLRIHHNMTVAQYRVKYGIPGCSHRNPFNIAAYMNGKPSPRRKYSSPTLRIKCSECPREFDIKSGYYYRNVALGKTGFACSGPCRNKLKSKTIAAVRGTVESREKTRKQMITRWKDPLWADYFSKKMLGKGSDWHIKRTAAVLESLARNGKTKPESKVEAVLLSSGLRFIYSGSGAFNVGGLFPDFVNIDDKVIVEVQGCYWHNCKKCFNGNGHKKNKARDARKDRVYNRNGWSCIKVWEHDLKIPGWEQRLLSDILDRLTNSNIV